MTTTLDIANKIIIALLLKLIFMYKYHIGDKVFLKSPLKLLILYNITTYRTRAIIIRGLYTFYPILKAKNGFFKELFS